MKYLSFVFLFLILSCNKSHISDTKKEFPQQNIALLVDNSITMYAKDFEPNRITVLQDVLKKIITNKKENQAFSIVVFSGNSYILCPLTKDKNQLLSAVNRLDFGILNLKFGTNFSNPLLSGISSLNTELNNKSIILFSDGKENVKSYPIDIPIEDAITNNIKINSILITPKDFKIEPIQMDLQNNFKFAKTKAEPFDTSQLEKIATKTGGTFKILYTKEELNAFDFQQLISEAKTLKIEKTLSKEDHEKLSKIYKEIEITNDSLAVRFN